MTEPTFDNNSTVDTISNIDNYEVESEMDFFEEVNTPRIEALREHYPNAFETQKFNDNETAYILKAPQKNKNDEIDFPESLSDSEKWKSLISLNPKMIFTPKDGLIVIPLAAEKDLSKHLGEFINTIRDRFEEPGVNHGSIAYGNEMRKFEVVQFKSLQELYMRAEIAGDYALIDFLRMIDTQNRPKKEHFQGNPWFKKLKR